MMVRESLDYLTEIRGLKSKEDLLDSFKCRLSDLGIKQFTYRLSYLPDDVPSKFLWTTFRKDWAEFYFENKLNSVDPVVSRLKTDRLPFLWGDHWSQEVSKEDKIFFDQATEFGFRDGMAFPLFKNSSETSGLTLTPDVKRKDFYPWYRRNFDSLHSISVLFNEALLAQFTEKQTVTLTEREKECLLWTAKGKTGWEIGELLSLSSSTVKFHLANSRRKLSVHSKHQAVLKAIDQGLIEP